MIASNRARSNGPGAAFDPRKFRNQSVVGMSLKLCCFLGASRGGPTELFPEDFVRGFHEALFTLVGVLPGFLDGLAVGGFGLARRRGGLRGLRLLGFGFLSLGFLGFWLCSRGCSGDACDRNLASYFVETSRKNVVIPGELLDDGAGLERDDVTLGFEHGGLGEGDGFGATGEGDDREEETEGGEGA